MCSQEELQTPKVERQVQLSNNAAATVHIFQIYTLRVLALRAVSVILYAQEVVYCV